MTQEDLGRVLEINQTNLSDVESITIGGVPMPSSFFAELVRYYSRSEQYPDGVDVREPFDLPYGMSELRVEHEQVVVVH